MIVFAFACMINFCYAGYIRAVGKGTIWKAVLFGEMVTVMAAYNVREFVRDASALIPLIIGGMVGTICSIKYNK
jgi:hypothetical protein